MIPLQHLKDILDSLSRASRSLGHLSRFCTMAAQSSSEEKSVIDESNNIVKLRIEQAENP